MYKKEDIEDAKLVEDDVLVADETLARRIILGFVIAMAVGILVVALVSYH
jgi:hypothetical protein